MIAVGSSQIVVSKFDKPGHCIKPILEQFDDCPVKDADAFDQAAAALNIEYMGIFDFDPGMLILALQGITVTSMTHFIEPAGDQVACVTKIHCDSSVDVSTRLIEQAGTDPAVTRLLRYTNPEVTVNCDVIKVSETMGIDQVVPLK